MQQQPLVAQPLAGASTQQQQQPLAAAQQQQQQPAAGGAGASAAPSVDDLYLCQDKLRNATVVEQLPQLKIEQVLDSRKARSPQDITLVTQLSFERCAPGGVPRGAGSAALRAGWLGATMCRSTAPPQARSLSGPALLSPHLPHALPASGALLNLAPARPGPSAHPAACTCWRASATCGTASSPPPSTSRCSTARW